MNEANQVPSTAGQGGWLESNHGAAVVFAFALTILYVAPTLLCLIALVATDGFAEGHWALTWFAAFAADHENTLSEIHQILMPVMAAVSVATFTTKPSRSMLALAVMILALFFLTVAMSVFFDMGSTQNRIAGSGTDVSMDDVKQFFQRQREVLLTFAMMLLGIRVTTRGSK
jgi:hypothetical protein